MSILSNKAILTIAAVAYVAQHHEAAPVTAKTISGHFNLVPRHLELVLQALVHAGILKGIRGPTGGYMTAKEPNAITLDTIVDLVDKLSMVTDPAFVGVAVDVDAAVTQLAKPFRAALAGMSIADLMAAKRRDAARLHDLVAP
jgi:Rrf2 family protein